MNVLATRQRVAPALTRYGSTAVGFHWAVAALVVFLGTLGLLFDDIPKESRPFWINVHGCVRLCLFRPCHRETRVANVAQAALIYRPTSASSNAAFRLRRTISFMR